MALSAKPEGKLAGALSDPTELKRWKVDRISRSSIHLIGRKTSKGMQ